MHNCLDGGGGERRLHSRYASRLCGCDTYGWAAFEAKGDILQDERFALAVYNLDLRPTLQFASCRSLIGYLDEKGDCPICVRADCAGGEISRITG